MIGNCHPHFLSIFDTIFDCGNFQEVIIEEQRYPFKKTELVVIPTVSFVL